MTGADGSELHMPRAASLCSMLSVVFSATAASSSDVTATVHAEQVEKGAPAGAGELAHVTRVSTLGEVTASFAHEVNQPLAAIANNANASLGLLRAGVATWRGARSPARHRRRQRSGRVPSSSACAALAKRFVTGDVRLRLEERPWRTSLLSRPSDRPRAASRFARRSPLLSRRFRANRVELQQVC